MVEVTEADDEGTATLEMTREEIFMFRNAAFEAARNDDDDGNRAALIGVREMFPVPSDRTAGISLTFTAGEMVDITNALFGSAAVAEADDREATARRLRRQVIEVTEGLYVAGASWEAEVRNMTAYDGLRGDSEVTV